MSNQLIDKTYMSICSERTLQSNENGFFMNFAEHIAKTVGEKWIKNVFGKLTTDKERIRTVYEYEPIRNIIIEFLSNVQEIYRKKSPEISQTKRLEAENLLKQDEKQKSLLLFSQSVLRAPKTDVCTKIDCGKTLALALWGRSQAHIACENYSEALKDIQLSLKENLPNIYRAEAYWKMAICYKALNEQNKADVAFSLAEKLLIDNNIKQQLQQDKTKTYTTKENEHKQVEPIINEKHEIYPCASRKINVRQSKELGRYVVSNEGVKTGDTLVVEPPYAACLLPDMFGTNCHHCFVRLSSPIGCTDCSSVAFCTIECRDIALNTYHKYECKYLDILIGSGMSILSHTALRMITQNPFNKCLDIYKNRKIQNVYTLCTNERIRKGDDFLQRTLMAAFLLRCLQKSGYFGIESNHKVIPNEEQFRIGELLLYNLQMLQFNAHEIYETRTMGSNTTKLAYIGVAIYPTVALFNHDCYPAVTRYFIGKKIVIKAIRSLQPNELIAENYGPIFTRRNLQQRQNSLIARYWFNCKCKACTFNWPGFNSGLENVSKMIKCINRKCLYYFTLPLQQTKLTCPKCKKNVDLMENITKLNWCEEQYEIGIKAANKREYQKGIEILCTAIDVFHSISCPPHKTTHLAQETLRECFADNGNVYDYSVIS